MCQKGARDAASNRGILGLDIRFVLLRSSWLGGVKVMSTFPRPGARRDRRSAPGHSYRIPTRLARACESA